MSGHCVASTGLTATVGWSLSDGSGRSVDGQDVAGGQAPKIVP
jgi:hypothetical protein